MRNEKLIQNLDQLIGMPFEEAKALIRSWGGTAHREMRDDEGMLGVANVRFDRVRLSTVKDIVTAASLG